LHGVSANIYFGTTPGSLAFLTSQNNPENIVELANHLTLKGNTNYYWRVDTVLANSSVVTGDIWSFKTMITREFLPWASRTIQGGANWSLTGNSHLTYDNSGTHHANRALIYSTEAHQSDSGLKLTVGYTTGSTDSENAHMFSFGLVSSETNLSTYSGENPFTEQHDVYSLGVSVVANGNGSVQGLNFIDGSGTPPSSKSTFHPMVPFGAIPSTASRKLREHLPISDFLTSTSAKAIKPSSMDETTLAAANEFSTSRSNVIPLPHKVMPLGPPATA